MACQNFDKSSGNYESETKLLRNFDFSSKKIDIKDGHIIPIL